MKKLLIIALLVIGCKKEDKTCYLCEQRHSFYQNNGQPITSYIDTSWVTCGSPVSYYETQGDSAWYEEITVKCRKVDL